MNLTPELLAAADRIRLSLRPRIILIAGPMGSRDWQVTPNPEVHLSNEDLLRKYGLIPLSARS